MRGPIRALHYAHECAPRLPIGQATAIALRMLLCRTRPTVRNKNFKRLLAGRTMQIGCARSAPRSHSDASSFCLRWVGVWNKNKFIWQPAVVSPEPLNGHLALFHCTVYWKNRRSIFNVLLDIYLLYILNLIYMWHEMIREGNEWQNIVSR